MIMIIAIFCIVINCKTTGYQINHVLPHHIQRFLPHGTEHEQTSGAGILRPSQILPTIITKYTSLIDNIKIRGMYNENHTNVFALNS